MLKSILYVTALLIPCIGSATATPMFNIAPSSRGGNTFYLSDQRSTSVFYQVGNNTRIARILTLNPTLGLTMNTGLLGGCDSPFVVLPRNANACQLSLSVNGSQVPAGGLHLGPQVCATSTPSGVSPSPFLCSQPSAENALNIIPKPAYLYVTNTESTSTLGTVGKCDVEAGRDPTNCVTTSVPSLRQAYGVTLNAQGTKAYIPYNPSGIDDRLIEMCDVELSSGDLINCVDSGAQIPVTLDGARIRGLALSPNDKVAFISRGEDETAGGSDAVFKCDVNASTGALSSCVDASTGVTLTESIYPVTLNAAGSLMYIPNHSSATTFDYTLCQVDQATNLLTSCATFDNVSPPAGTLTSLILLNQANTIAYVIQNNNVVRCFVNSGNGQLENCQNENIIDTAPVNGLQGAALNAAETTMYLVGGYDTLDTGSTCQINATTKLPDSCVNNATFTGVTLRSATLG